MHSGVLFAVVVNYQSEKKLLKQNLKHFQEVLTELQGKNENVFGLIADSS